jgi:hypothetical protein
MPHELQSQGGQDQEGTIATTQHIVLAGPNEVVRQGCRRHMSMACNCMGLHPVNGLQLHGPSPYQWPTIAWASTLAMACDCVGLCPSNGLRLRGPLP